MIRAGYFGRLRFRKRAENGTAAGIVENSGRVGARFGAALGRAKFKFKPKVRRNFLLSSVATFNFADSFFNVPPARPQMLKTNNYGIYLFFYIFDCRIEAVLAGELLHCSEYTRLVTLLERVDQMRKIVIRMPKSPDVLVRDSLKKKIEAESI